MDRGLSPSYQLQLFVVREFNFLSLSDDNLLGMQMSIFTLLELNLKPMNIKHGHGAHLNGPTRKLMTQQSLNFAFEYPTLCKVS